MEINLLKYITFKRFYNIIKVLSSFTISRLIRGPVIWGMPLSYTIEPTNHCNLKCTECPSGLGTLTRPLGMMKPDYFNEIIQQISPTGFYIQLFFQGEPYINKSLPEMIRYAQGRGMYVSVSTNGHFIQKSNLDLFLNSAPDKIIFSIDGLDEETYQNYRVGGSFAKADEGLSLITHAKKTKNLKKPFIELQFIVMRQNEHLLSRVEQYGKSRGVDKVVFKTMQVSTYENAVHFLPQKKEYRRYDIKDEGFKIRNKLRNHCFALWRTSVITWDGKVVPCCFDKNAEFEFGSINGRDFNNIWKSEGYQFFRKKVLHDRKGIGICSNCTAGMKMNILEVEQ